MLGQQNNENNDQDESAQTNTNAHDELLLDSNSMLETDLARVSLVDAFPVPVC
jgi:hypothetical protein